MYIFLANVRYFFGFSKYKFILPSLSLLILHCCISHTQLLKQICLTWALLWCKRYHKISLRKLVYKRLNKPIYFMGNFPKFDLRPILWNPHLARRKGEAEKVNTKMIFLRICRMPGKTFFWCKNTPKEVFYEPWRVRGRTLEGSWTNLGGFENRPWRVWKLTFYGWKINPKTLPFERPKIRYL